ncbi:TetR/AcrR family transcriptional regulator [Rhodococcus rhodochrous]|uniref:TetR/AcrR family transcriptional regulator n=1 Tax=Rhodococcus rhodochrous TaxID=1829 RepID=UPI0006C88311|nr:TetR/AcrR family transcriptional regulator [Rhodococcus rhodochrous]
MPPKRSAERHAEVLDAAIELIRQKGIDGTSLQDIADAVGIKKGSLNTYFSSKEELVELIQARFTEVAERELRLIGERTDLTPDQRLRELLYFHAEHCTLRVSSPVLVGFMQLWTSSSSPSGRHQPSVVREYQRVFEDAVAQCSRKRIFRKIDPVLTVNGLMGSMSWCAFWYNKDEHGPLRPLVDEIIDMAFDGLRAKG